MGNVKLVVLLGIMPVVLVSCATGEFSHIDQTYEERIVRCADPASDDRKIFPTEESCIADANSIRKESKANQTSIRRFLPGGGRGAGDTKFIYILN